MKQDYPANFGFGPFTYQLQIAATKNWCWNLTMRTEKVSNLSLRFVAETDRWYHFAFTFDDATREATIYVDGEASCNGNRAAVFVFHWLRSQVGQGNTSGSQLLQPSTIIAFGT